MSPTLPPHKMSRRQKGIALVTVISVIAVLTLLTVAMLSMSQSEKSASVRYADGESANHLANSAVNLMMGQIWEGTSQEGDTSNRKIWASQPGAIRKYNQNGSFFKGYKLYSDDDMVVEGNEKSMVEDTPSSDWRTLTGQWTDLNEPVIRPDSAGDSDTAVEVIFPILDPRAFVSTRPSPDPSIEGFSYKTALPGVVNAASATDVNARLPMPVQWLYILQDGTLGSMVASGTTGDITYEFQGVGGKKATADNPIVGRIACWTDDETCKININTAGEPTYTGTPMFHHDREQQWANFQPTLQEYQRYPGHPATVALSTVLFPNQVMDLYGIWNVPFTLPLTGAAKTIFDRKERIYAIMPKLNNGGSASGTQPFMAFISTSGAPASAQKQYVSVSQSLKERLYASVDELLFSETVNASKEREAYDNQSGAVKLFSEFTTQERGLQRVRGFLTAHSRAPETNLFGMPRVAVWPVADSSLGTDRRTGYDNLIAFCSSLGRTPSTPDTVENSYYFRRKDADSATTDVNIARNLTLLNYLYTLMGYTFPSGGSGAGGNFKDKYDADAPQILVEIFDYIRSTNLYDSLLSPDRNTLLNSPAYQVTNLNTTQLYAKRPTSTKTYTDDRASRNADRFNVGTPENLTDAAFPGHGQVAPTRVQLGDQACQGFGRFMTLSEIGYQIICTGDGTLDPNSYALRELNNPTTGTFKKTTNPNYITGGKTTARMDKNYDMLAPSPGVPDIFYIDTWLTGQQRAVWYSNYPPFPAADRYGTVDADRGKTITVGTAPNQVIKPIPTDPDYHPGYRPYNWNATLADDTPLLPGQRRIQAMVCLEVNNPSSGWGGLFPDFCLTVEFQNDVTVTDSAGASQVLFKKGTKIVRNRHTAFQMHHHRAVGGNANPQGFVDGRRVRDLERTGAATPQFLVKDPGAVADPGSGRFDDGYINFDLVSDFITVSSAGPLTVSGTGVVVKIYSANEPAAAYLAQDNTIAFPQFSAPVPELVTFSRPRYGYIDIYTGLPVYIAGTDGLHWWGLNYGGVINRYEPTVAKQAYRPNANPKNARPVTNFNFTGDVDADLRADTATGLPLPWKRHIEAMPDRRSTCGRFRSDFGSHHDVSGEGVPSVKSVFWGQDFRSAFWNSQIVPAQKKGADVIRSMVPTHGDVRLIAAKQVTTAADWRPHPLWDSTTPGKPADNDTFMAHNFARYFSNHDPGFDQGPPYQTTPAPTTGGLITAQTPNAAWQGGGNVWYYRPDGSYGLVKGAVYQASVRPDVPNHPDIAALANRYGDFDNAVGNLRDGGYINKSDEGNTSVANMKLNLGTAAAPNPTTVRHILSYYHAEWVSAENVGALMTPNRMMPSPAMFGSLPTGVKAGDPWKTLLFRPHVKYPNNAYSATAHPGAPGHTGGTDPADHYLLDLFWMPVVEPYAISEPFSTAGKINLNYQMVPFNSYIRRATGLHAVMKGELMQAVPTRHALDYKREPGGNTTINLGGVNFYMQKMWSQTDPTVTNRRFWHRNIEVEREHSGQLYGVVRQIEDRFNFVDNAAGGAPPASHGLFRTASQICEIHLIPKKVQGNQPNPATANYDGSDTNSAVTGVTPYTVADMPKFWEDRAITGDNSRERPYVNIYPRVTTQSNTFRVHYRVQTIKKARSVEPNIFDPRADAVTAEYRGSTLVERRIDPADTRIQDYAARTDPTELEPLDNFYNFRVLETKRFAP